MKYGKFWHKHRQKRDCIDYEVVRVVLCVKAGQKKSETDEEKELFSQIICTSMFNNIYTSYDNRDVIITK